MAVAFVASVGMASAAETKPTVKKALLLADQVTRVGTLIVSDSSTIGIPGTIDITYTTRDDWKLTAYHVYVSTDKAPTKSAPGRFPFKNDYVCPAATSIPVQTIPSPGCGPDVTLYIAAHAVLQRDTLRVDADGNPIYEVETVWADGTQIGRGKNWAMCFEVDIPCPEMTVEKEMDSQITPSPGADVTFDITVTNIGPYNLETVNVVDILPDGMIFVSDNSGGSPSGQEITWNLGPMRLGASTTISLIARIDEKTEVGTPLTNVVTVTGTTAAGYEGISTDKAEVIVVEAQE